jgi:PAS domain S-box-containing protein
MGQTIDRERNLIVLYDLALAIGGETTASGLMENMLQRLLFHTGYPVGIIAKRLSWDASPPMGLAPVLIEAVIGDNKLAENEGKIIGLPPDILSQTGIATTAPQTLVHFPSRKAFSQALTLPIPNYGAIVLLSRGPQSQNLDARMLAPIMERFATAIAMCREQEGYNDAFQRIMRASLEQSPVSIVVMDRAKQIIFSNPAFSAYFGYSIDEAKGQDLAILIADDSADLLDQIWQTVTDGTIWRGELHRRRKDGSEFWVNSTISPLRDSMGQVSHVMSVSEDITERKAQELRLKETVSRLDSVLRQTITAFSTATVHTDPYTAGHEYRVADLCVVLGERLGLAPDRLLGLELAARSHDIGQIRVPAEILLRSGSLSELEFEFIKLHVDAGWEILKNIDFPWPVAEIVRQHHENLDGTGYPRGLSGDKILPESRILRIADTVESLSSHRPFRAAHTRQEVIAQLMEMRGVKLDADMVDACIAILSGGYEFPPPPRL